MYYYVEATERFVHRVVVNADSIEDARDKAIERIAYNHQSVDTVTEDIEVQGMPKHTMGSWLEYYLGATFVNADANYLYLDNGKSVQYVWTSRTFNHVPKSGNEAYVVNSSELGGLVVLEPCYCEWHLADC